jgi:hypothetical protein
MGFLHGLGQKLNKLKAKRPQKWVFILKKLEFLRAKEDHRF